MSTLCRNYWTAAEVTHTVIWSVQPGYWATFSKALPFYRVMFWIVIGHTSRYGFIAAVAARSSISGAALHTHDALILGVEWLLGQRLVALCAAETLLMPVTPFVAQLLTEENKSFSSGTWRSTNPNPFKSIWRTHLCLHWDGSVAFCTGVGAELCVTANTHRLPLASDKPLPAEVLPAVKAVGAVCHRHNDTASGLKQEEQQNTISIDVKSAF